MANEGQLGAITQFETFMAPKSGSLNNPKISLASKRVKARFPLQLNL